MLLITDMVITGSKMCCHNLNGVFDHIDLELDWRIEIQKEVRLYIVALEYKSNRD